MGPWVRKMSLSLALRGARGLPSPPAGRRGLELESGKERRGQMASPRKQRQQALPRGPRVSEAGRCRVACLGDSGLKMDTSTTFPGCQWAMIFL